MLLTSSHHCRMPRPPAPAAGFLPARMAATVFFGFPEGAVRLFEATMVRLLG
jgi:hypothetical protein